MLKLTNRLVKKKLWADLFTIQTNKQRKRSMRVRYVDTRPYSREHCQQ